jgi:hypothetical protein
MQFARQHPADLVSLMVVGAVSLVTVLDLLELVSLSDQVLGSVAIFVGSLVALTWLTSRWRQRQADVFATQAKVELEAVKESLRRLEDPNNAHEIPANQVAHSLNSLLRESQVWRFRGGSGRWQRQVVLPRLGKIQQQSVQYTMQLLNPTDVELCTQYALYRSKQRVAAARRADEHQAEVLRDDLLACVYSAAWYSRYTRIQAHVVLLPMFSPLRIDIGSKGLVLTVADPDAPGLFAAAESWFYASLLDEIEQASLVLPKVVFPTDEACFTADRRYVTGDHVRQLLERVTIDRTGKQVDFLAEVSWAPVDFDRIANLAFP